MSDDLKDMIEKARAAFDRLTPAQKAAHLREQAIDFVHGNLALDGSKATREQIAQAYDETHPKDESGTP